MKDKNPRDSILLEEYKLCHAKVSALDQNIWQTASIFGIGSIVGIITLSQSFPRLPTLLIPAISLAAIGLLLTWYRYTRRWWSIQQLTLLRSKHIEEYLRLGMTSYVEFRDAYELEKQPPNNNPDSKNAATLPAGLERYKEEIINRSNYEYRGIQPITRFIVGVSIISWLVSPALLFAEKPRVWQDSEIAVTCILVIVFLALLHFQWRKQ